MFFHISWKWVLTLVVTYISLPLLIYYIIPYIFYGNKSTKKRIIIYVLGDLGHSPRICYHAASFSQKGWQVELCGYVEETVPKFISEDPNIIVHALPIIKIKGNKKSIVFLAKKVLSQVLNIIKQLWDLRGSSYILIQNPPSIPILPIAVLFRLTGCKLIIDWHNLAYSIMQLKFSGKFYHPLVLSSYMVEFIFSRFATYHLTVTEAMKDYLVNSFHINSKRCVVLYDRPAPQFKPISNTDSRKDLLKQDFVKDLIPTDFDVSAGDKIIVTSTSFTPDEDIGVLIGALKIYDHSYQTLDKTLPKILCFVTGKGPLKKQYVKEVEEHNWQHVSIRFVWLTSEDYPKLLQLCDYGVSLHTSSSGLDLPMKILDMFGSGLPVIAMNYPVLGELVKYNKNGLKFLDRRELHESLIFAMKDENVYKKVKQGALEESKHRWSSSWEPAMKELRIIT
ncbi:Chitobiosyldiphosphodolichol beta-mannosyltransferase [Nakaseomyces bracarensis]|uniref:Chitobiosyldiphosphodolichol beta-mannosyltransferase n=1 Tax=Nakaseomyces bracarensis TaxID=273131 RepID=A0ABR4NYA5_9SACH